MEMYKGIFYRNQPEKYYTVYPEYSFLLLFLNAIFKVCLLIFTCVCTYMGHAYIGPKKSKHMSDSYGAGVTCSCGLWVTNSGPLEGKESGGGEAILSTDISPIPKTYFPLCVSVCLCICV